MDYRALAELVMFSLMGLSVLILSVGFSVRLFLAPTLREIFDRLGRGKQDAEGLLAHRLDRLDDRLAALESGMDRLVAADEFDRRLLGARGEEPDRP